MILGSLATAGGERIAARECGEGIVAVGVFFDPIARIKFKFGARDRFTRSGDKSARIRVQRATAN